MLLNTPVEKWDQMIDTNIKGLLYVTKPVLSLMLARNSGHIINIGSITAHYILARSNV
jgi:3-hydroxy acid dehydrogenase / malonic semialdehyde reductase